MSSNRHETVRVEPPTGLLADIRATARSERRAQLRRTLLIFALTFTAGAAYECGCVFWVHYAERQNAGAAVGFSMFNAVVTVIGVEAFLRRRLFAFAYVLGYGAGTWLGVAVIARWWM